MVLTRVCLFNSHAVRDHIMKHMLVLPVMLVIMIPCTGGTRWHHINPRSGSGFLRLKKHRQLFKKLWSSFEKLLPAAYKTKSCVILEWPASCEYWTFKRVVTTLSIYGFKFAYADGCSYGVESVVREGLIQKKWKFAYLNCDFAEVLRRRNRKCDGTHDHVHCQGKYIGLTGWYPHRVK